MLVWARRWHASRSLRRCRHAAASRRDHAQLAPVFEELRRSRSRPTEARRTRASDIRYTITVLDRKTRQPIENGDGQLFAQPSTDVPSGRIETYDGFAYGPEVGVYHAKLSFVIPGTWAVGDPVPPRLAAPAGADRLDAGRDQRTAFEHSLMRHFYRSHLQPADVLALRRRVLSRNWALRNTRRRRSRGRSPARSARYVCRSAPRAATTPSSRSKPTRWARAVSTAT